MSDSHHDMMRSDFALRRMEKEKLTERILKVAREDRDLRASAIGERFGKTTRAIQDLLAVHGLSRRAEGLRLVAKKRRQA